MFNDTWCLAHADIHTLSLGAARPSDFDEHLQALPLLDSAPVVLPPIVARLEAAYRDALGDDFARGWRTGLRDWTELPGKVNVRRILWLDNIARAYDLVDYARERYMAMSPDDHWVPGARAADIDDAVFEAALPDSPFRSRIPELLRRAHTFLHDPTVRPQP